MRGMCGTQLIRAVAVVLSLMANGSAFADSSFAFTQAPAVSVEAEQEAEAVANRYTGFECLDHPGYVRTRRITDQNSLDTLLSPFANSHKSTSDVWLVRYIGVILEIPRSNNDSSWTEFQERDFALFIDAATGWLLEAVSHSYETRLFVRRDIPRIPTERLIATWHSDSLQGVQLIDALAAIFPSLRSDQPLAACLMDWGENSSTWQHGTFWYITRHGIPYRGHGTGADRVDWIETETRSYISVSSGTGQMHSQRGQSLYSAMKERSRAILGGGVLDSDSIKTGAFEALNLTQMGAEPLLWQTGWPYQVDLWPHKETSLKWIGRVDSCALRPTRCEIKDSAGSAWYTLDVFVDPETGRFLRVAMTRLKPTPKHASKLGWGERIAGSRRAGEFVVRSERGANTMGFIELLRGCCLSDLWSADGVVGLLANWSKVGESTTQCWIVFACPTFGSNTATRLIFNAATGELVDRRKIVY